MLTEDYFMRMINQILAVLTKIIGLKDVGQYQEAQQIVNQSLEQLLQSIRKFWRIWKSALRRSGFSPDGLIYGKVLRYTISSAQTDGRFQCNEYTHHPRRISL